MFFGESGHDTNLVLEYAVYAILYSFVGFGVVALVLDGIH